MNAGTKVNLLTPGARPHRKSRLRFPKGAREGGASRPVSSARLFVRPGPQPLRVLRPPPASYGTSGSRGRVGTLL